MAQKTAFSRARHTDKVWPIQTFLTWDSTFQLSIIVSLGASGAATAGALTIVPWIDWIQFRLFT